MIKLTTVRDETLKELTRALQEVKPTGRKGDILKQGIIGEAIAFEMLWHEYDGDVQMTEDWWDSEKDGTVQGQTYEVKTIFPFMKERVYSIEASQERKITSVDRLIIVRVPASDQSTIRVYEVPQDQRRMFQLKETAYGSVLNYSFTQVQQYGILDNSTIAKVLTSFHPTAKNWNALPSLLRS